MKRKPINHHGIEHRFEFSYHNFKSLLYDSELCLVLLQIQTVTSLMDASTTVDVFLIDYGTEEKNVKFPR